MSVNAHSSVTALSKLSRIFKKEAKLNNLQDDGAYENITITSDEPLGREQLIELGKLVESIPNECTLKRSGPKVSFSIH